MNLDILLEISMKIVDEFKIFVDKNKDSLLLLSDNESKAKRGMQILSSEKLEFKSQMDDLKLHNRQGHEIFVSASHIESKMTLSDDDGMFTRLTCTYSSYDVQETVHQVKFQQLQLEEFKSQVKSGDVMLL